jgi:hypothetical protein
MTDAQKHIILDLLKDKTKYIKNNGNGRRPYKMYAANVVPLYYIKKKEFQSINFLLKKDKKHRFTVNLSAVRQLHGNNKIKKAYKQSISK